MKHLRAHIGPFQIKMTNLYRNPLFRIVQKDTVPNDSYRFWADLHLEGHV